MIYPEQRKLSSQKTPEWYKDNRLYFMSLASFQDGEYQKMSILARAAEGELVGSDYDYILNRYGTEDASMIATPAKMRNMNIIKPIVEARLGERSKFPFNYNTIVLNDDIDNKYIEGLNQKIRAAMAQDVVNQLNAAGVLTGVDTKELPEYQQIIADHQENWQDERAIFGQDALEYILYDQDLIDKYQDMFKDWLIYGRSFSYKSSRFNNVEIERIHPMDFWCSKSANSNFVEDSTAIVVRRRFKLAEILDRFRNFLKEKDIKLLEEWTRSVAQPETLTGGVEFIRLDEHIEGKNYMLRENGNNIYVNHIVWKGQKKVGHLFGVDELGMTYEREVEDNYKLDREAGDLNIEWEWVNCWHEMCSVDDRIDFMMQEGLEQRSDLNNNSVCKLPYNGRIKTTDTGEIVSTVKDGLVYQGLFNIYHYNREKIINKNRDKILLLPLGMIPQKFGKTSGERIDKFLYWLDGSNLAFIDETAPNAAMIMQNLKSIDLGLGTYIEELTKIIADVKAEFWDTVGFNRQRFGETYASDGKGVNEQALFRSSILTAEDDRKFDKFVEKDLNGLLDFSKVAWIGGKKSMYMTSDQRQKMLILNPDDSIKHLETNYGVFVVNTQTEMEKLKMQKDFAFGYAQKANVAPELVAEIIDATNFSKLKKFIKRAEDARKVYEQQVAQQEAENNQALQESINADREAERTSKEAIASNHDAAMIEAALISAEATVLGFDKGEGGEGDAALIEGNMLKRQEFQQKLNMDREKLNQKKADDKRKADLKVTDQEIAREKIKSQEKIAKSRPKPKAK